jgi:hypothetical protein
LKGGFRASTDGPGISSTHRGQFPQPTTELDDNLGTAELNYNHGQQMDKQKDEGFYNPEGFPSIHVTRQEIIMGYARITVRINQSINQTVHSHFIFHISLQNMVQQTDQPSPFVTSHFSVYFSFRAAN